MRKVRSRILEMIKTIINKIKKDLKNYDINNTDENKVIAANYFSAYKKTFVIKPPIGSNVASYGILIIGNKVTKTDTVKHEYGHKLQLKNRGIVNYTFRIAIPSVTANILERLGKLPYDYYSSPWEAEADRLGNVKRLYQKSRWSEGMKHPYRYLFKLFLGLSEK